MKEVNYFFSCAVDKKYTIDDFYTCGVVGFMVKAKFLQSRCFAKRATKAFLTKDWGALSFLEQEYKEREKWSQDGGIFRGGKQGYTNPVSFFIDQVQKAKGVEKNDANLTTLALLSFYHEYSYKWEDALYEGCCDIAPKDIHKKEKEVLAFLTNKVGKIGRVLRYPTNIKSSKISDIMSILSQHFIIAKNSEYKQLISKSIENFCLEKSQHKQPIITPQIATRLSLFELAK